MSFPSTGALVSRRAAIVQRVMHARSCQSLALLGMGLTEHELPVQQRLEAIEGLVRSVREGHPDLDRVLISLACEAIAWVECISEAEEVSITSGDAAA